MENTNSPRMLTEEEVRETFLRHVWKLIEHWNDAPRYPEPRAKLEGLAFSILSTLDCGNVGGLPGFVVAPRPLPDDKAYAIEHNQNWYPQNHESKVECDIAGVLHEEFHDIGRKLKDEMKQ